MEFWGAAHMDDLDKMVAWLREAQRVDLAPSQVREPAATALHLGDLAGQATQVLPFGVEPAGFYLAQSRLSRGGDST